MLSRQYGSDNTSVAPTREKGLMIFIVQRRAPGRMIARLRLPDPEPVGGDQVFSESEF